MITQVALYARVSSAMQLDGFSLEVQLLEMRELARKEGWTVVREYVEKGYSAKTDKRPEFWMLMRDAKLHLFDGIVVYKLDRLYRNQLEMLQCSRLLNELQIQLISKHERFDFNTTSGTIVLSVMGALGEVYIKNLSEDTKRGKFGRVENGLSNGALPFGYCRGLCSACKDPHGKGYCPNFGQANQSDGKHPILHPKDGPAAQEAFALYAGRQHSAAKIAQQLNAAGFCTRTGHPFTGEAVLDLLRNPFYAGWVSYKRELHRGIQPALVDQATFDACQAILTESRRAPRSRETKQFFLLTHLLRCAECGYSLVGHTNRHFRRSGQVTRARYYRERAVIPGLIGCASSMIPAEKLEREVAARIQQIQLPALWQERILLLSQANSDVAAYDRRRRETQSRLSRLQDLYVKGEMTKDEYQRTQRLYSRDLADIEITLQRQDTGARKWVENFGDLWAHMTREEQRRVLHALVEAVYVRNGAVESIELQPLFRDLVKFPSRAPKVGKNSQERV